MGIGPNSAAQAANTNICNWQGDEAAAPQLKRNETIIFEALSRSKRPMKAYALLDLLRERGVKAPMTVYRALDTLMEKGCVKKNHQPERLCGEHYGMSLSC